MQIHDPSVLLVGLLVFLQGLLMIVSGRSAAAAERKKQDALTQQARTDAAATFGASQENIAHTNIVADYKRVTDELKELRTEVDARNAKLSQHKTNAWEMFELMDVPGAMEVLKKYRDHYESQQNAIETGQAIPVGIERNTP